MPNEQTCNCSDFRCSCNRAYCKKHLALLTFGQLVCGAIIIYCVNGLGNTRSMDDTFHLFFELYTLLLICCIFFTTSLMIFLTSLCHHPKWGQLTKTCFYPVFHSAGAVLFGYTGFIVLGSGSLNQFPGYSKAAGGFAIANAILYTIGAGYGVKILCFDDD